MNPEKLWSKLSPNEIADYVHSQVKKNFDYDSKKHLVLGVPGSVLDERIFYDDFRPLREGEAPFLAVLQKNPNHIGCHTMGKSEPFFKGTQQIELEVLRICAETILRAKKGQYDGYISSGATESNLQALWVFRNYFRKHSRNRTNGDRIAVVYSEDSHYSLSKACNILDLQPIKVKVDKFTRAIDMNDLAVKLSRAKKSGIVFIILCLNMGTTMFGSVDDAKLIIAAVKTARFEKVLVHVDAAFGGFIYPILNPKDSSLSFLNKDITSFALDAHKMLQAPYGTGIFLVRKGFLDFVVSEDANYVPGKDRTVIGSRSGANAVAVWMILRAWGYREWRGKVEDARNLCQILHDGLTKKGIRCFWNPFMNIVAIEAKKVQLNVANKYHLVPDVHDGKKSWWKVVVMRHVTEGVVRELLEDIR